MSDRPVIFFEVAGKRFGAEVAQVKRIGTKGENGLVLQTWLGEAGEGARGLVIEGDRAVGADRILGVQPGARIHPLPPLAAACIPSGTVCGLVELENELFPLVDLAALLREAPAGEGEHGE